MTAPLFHVDPADLDGVTAGSLVEVTGPEARHAASAQRLGAGEEVLLADGQGQGVEGEVVSAAPDLLVVRVSGRRDEPVPDLRLVLVQALAKGGRDESAVEAATELGVDEVVPWEADRSIVRWRGPRAAKAHQKWVNVATAAAKQSRRARTPVVDDPVTTKGLAARLRDASGTALVLHEEASDPIAHVELPASGDILLVVGPEGGISPDELDLLRAGGAQAVRLGDAVLRSSTAGPAAVAVLSARLRWT